MGIGGPNIGDEHLFASFFGVHQLIHRNIMEEEPQQYLAMMEMSSLLSVVHPLLLTIFPLLLELFTLDNVRCIRIIAGDFPLYC